MFLSAEASRLGVTDSSSVILSSYSTTGSSGSWTIDADDVDRDSDKLVHESNSDKSTDKPLEKLTDKSLDKSGRSDKAILSFRSIASHPHSVDLTMKRCYSVTKSKMQVRSHEIVRWVSVTGYLWLAFANVGLAALQNSLILK